VKKSKTITLTLLSGMALAASACSDEPEPKENDPYNDYSYVGKATEPGVVYSSYANGILTWYLMSRMFNGFGYGAMRAGSYYASQPRYFTRSTPSTGRYTSVARNGFGRVGAYQSARS
jgi:hypothetical protein